jgi:serine/threonine-protein kinase
MEPRDVVNGRFEIDRVAGRGGMGTVFRATDRQTGAAVAVKVILGRGPELAERFTREAAVLADLQHPGIVRFVASGSTPAGEAYLVMEWMEGESLSERLSRGTLSIAETVALGRRVATALAHAHARGVVHRDIKPSNLFLEGGDLARVKILDFGIARITETGQGLTRTGQALGSPGYTSPEQARGEKSLDARADVFSLACVLFACLTGEPPFTGPPLQVLMKVVMDPAPLASARRQDVPPALEDLLQRMLAKQPAARPADAAAVAAALGVLAPRPSLPPHPSIAPGTPPRQSVPPRSTAMPAVSEPVTGTGPTFNITGPVVRPDVVTSPPTPPPTSTPASMRTPPPASAPVSRSTAPAPPAPASARAPLPPSVPVTNQGPPSTLVRMSALPPTAVSAPVMTPLPAPAPAPAVTPPRAATKRPLVLAALGGALVTIGLLVAAVFFFFELSATDEHGAFRLPAFAMRPCTGMAHCTPYNPPDPAHVDPVDVYSPALALAQTMDKGAAFCEMALVGAVDGTVASNTDVHAAGQSLVQLRYAPGKGARGVFVTMMRGQLFATEGTSCSHAVPVPACTPKAAAHAAVASGVPRGTSATMLYHDPGTGPVWEFVATGHVDHTRRIDGRTCAVVYRPSR